MEAVLQTLRALSSSHGNGRVREDVCEWEGMKGGVRPL